jgi:hypothetical protein
MMKHGGEMNKVFAFVSVILGCSFAGAQGPTATDAAPTSKVEKTTPERSMSDRVQRDAKRDARPIRDITAPSEAKTEEAEDPLKTLEYPELLVTPRATDRLEIEARDEGMNSWVMHLPLQLAAAMTYYAGKTAIDANNDLPVADRDSDVNSAGRAATYLGLGWVGASFYLAAGYRPYRDAVKELKPLPRGTKREVLTRERLGEEAMHETAQVGARLAWLATGTMLPLNLYLAATGKEDAVLAGALGSIVSLAPVVFRSRWETISERHQFYKKRIYGPVAFNGLQKTGDTYVPTAQLLWSFE